MLLQVILEGIGLGVLLILVCAMVSARARCTRSPRDSFIKNTQAAPSVVPKKGIMIPRKVSIYLTAFA